MKKTILLMVAALVLFACSSAFAQADNFAIIDVQRIVADSKRGQAAVEDVKKFTERKRTEAEKKLTERDKKAQELERQIKSGIIAEDAINKKVEEFQAYVAEIEEFARKAEQDAREFAQRRETDVKVDLEAIVDRIGAEKGYLIIFRYENVVYNDKSIKDITDEVIAAYDALDDKK